MAVRDFAAVRRRDGTMVVTWTGLANGDSGAPFEAPAYADRTMQLTGTFGSGGTLLIEGSVDGSNFVTLTDPQGNAISKTAASIETVMENTVQIRPRVSAGDGTTALRVDLLLRGVPA